jgi:tyrosyl-tRNA synthetase
MKTNFIAELKWRGTLQDIMPGTEEQLQKESTTAYIGFDPTSDSLHVGSLAQIKLLQRFQQAGHKPIALVGGATGMIGDPSGKSQERNLLSEEILQHNISCIKKQLEKFLDFNSSSNAAELLNNYDWFKEYDLLNFLRDVGKHISINYMLAKDSVQSRLENGISFAEFSYQLLQGYDFYWLWKNKNCKLQMGGSDQWGNIVTGTELIRRMENGNAFALTIPLVTKSDGTKFGKTESGTIWLDAKRTSPYKFYQFWLNVSDEDATKYLHLFTDLNQDEIISLETKHVSAPHLREIQKALAKELTCLVHSQDDYQFALKASEILFGNAPEDSLKNLSAAQFADIFDGVPSKEISLAAGIVLIDLLTEQTGFIPSKSEARRLLQSKSISINKTSEIDGNRIISKSDLIAGKFILLQKGKKNYFLVIVK